MQAVWELVKALFYGIVEGVTEWLPISSTGHMILFEKFFPFDQTDAFMEMFRVVIQLGAILAVVVLFWKKLWPVGRRQEKLALKEPVIRLWAKIIVATLPAMVLGLLLDDWLDAHFYNFVTVALMLIVYGLLFILVENGRKGKPNRVERLGQLTYKDALIIGMWQVLAMIPGTSRSGATIVGALLMGVARPAAAEFTFFLAIPVMFGASLLKVAKYVLKVGLAFTGLQWGVLATGTVVAFVVSLLAIRFLMNYVKKHDFKVFGWYRIALGAVLLVYYFLWGRPV